MTLNEYASKAKLEIFDALKAKQRPPRGTFDDAVFKEVIVRPAVQMGTTSYKPDRLMLEFLGQRPGDAAVILTVTLEAPEPIVFMPVPDWVIEDIYAGGVDGTFCFLSEAETKLEKFRQDVFTEANLRFFERQQAKRRE